MDRVAASPSAISAQERAAARARAAEVHTEAARTEAARTEADYLSFDGVVQKRRLFQQEIGDAVGANLRDLDESLGECRLWLLDPGANRIEASEALLRVVDRCQRYQAVPAKCYQLGSLHDKHGVASLVLSCVVYCTLPWQPLWLIGVVVLLPSNAQQCHMHVSTVHRTQLRLVLRYMNAGGGLRENLQGLIWNLHGPSLYW